MWFLQCLGWLRFSLPWGLRGSIWFAPITDQEWVASILTVLCCYAEPSISNDSYTDVKDLAHSALEPALAKVNQALVHIGELFKKTTDLVLYKFYGTCIDENQGAMTRHLPRTISALESNNYETSKQEAGSAATSADTCEQQFIPNKSPMADKNKKCSHARTLTFLF